MSKTIILTKGYFAIVDDEDYERIKNMKWRVNTSMGKLYAISHRSVLMHRYLMNPNDGVEIDHINGNGLDNRRENLRECSHIENLCNRKLNCNNVSGYKGVSVDKKTGRYKGKLVCAGKEIWLGRSDNAIELAKAYDEAAKEYFGEFAKLNFV